MCANLHQTKNYHYNIIRLMWLISTKMRLYKYWEYFTFFDDCSQYYEIQRISIDHYYRWGSHPWWYKIKQDQSRMNIVIGLCHVELCDIDIPFQSRRLKQVVARPFLQRCVKCHPKRWSCDRSDISHIAEEEVEMTSQATICFNLRLWKGIYITKNKAHIFLNGRLTFAVQCFALY